MTRRHGQVRPACHGHGWLACPSSSLMAGRPAATDSLVVPLVVVPSGKRKSVRPHCPLSALVRFSISRDT